MKKDEKRPDEEKLELTKPEESKGDNQSSHPKEPKEDDYNPDETIIEGPKT